MMHQLKLPFDMLVVAAIYLGIVTLSPDVANVLSNAAASLGGAVILVYFRRERSYTEVFFKAGCAAIMGYIVGWLATTYYEISEPAYKSATYFFAALLSIFFIKALLSATEQNAAGVIVSIIQRFLPANKPKDGDADTDAGKIEDK